MSLPPHLPTYTNSEKEFVHIRCLIANIHKPRNVSRPPSSSIDKGPPLEVVLESPASSDTERSVSDRSDIVSDRSDIVSDRSDIVSDKSDNVSVDELAPAQRAKSNSFGGSMLMAPTLHQHQNKKRRPSFLHFGGAEAAPGPLSAGPQFNVPKFTVTAPPGEQHRRLSHGFAAFHGFALRRHSNTVCARMICKCERVFVFIILTKLFVK